MSEFADAEGAYLSEVVPKIVEMWRRVGLTFTDGPGPDDLRIDVTAPLRDAAARRTGRLAAVPRAVQARWSIRRCVFMTSR
jgi:hypothetical protein